MIRWVTWIVALIGVAIAVYAAATAGLERPPAEPAAPPTVNPFDDGIAAVGIVEAASRNIAIASPEPALITAVHAEVGEQVAAGQALFDVDARALQAELRQAEAQVVVARARRLRLEAEPRPERVPVLEAAVDAAQAEVDRTRVLYETTQESFEREAASREELEQRRAEFRSAQARQAEAAAELRELQAGTWEAELAVARAEERSAEATVEALRLRIERLTVRAPIDGTVLKREIEPGEFWNPSPEGDPPMVLGDLSVLHVRAQVNEEDAPRLRAGATAVAQVRGPAQREFPLQMLRIEPLAIPKEQLTGVRAELIDTRVLDVMFRVQEPAEGWLYPGQVVDVFIEIP